MHTLPPALLQSGLSFLLVLVALIAAPARAQDCDCDHTVPLNVGEVDGDALGYEPGDRVCVTAGERQFLRFQHLTGTAEAPIVIINCGGLVRIHNTDRAYALVFEDDSRFFHLTGTGDPALTYGFEISAPDRDPWPGVGLWLNGRSTNYEVDHVEVHDTGFAGVMSKTDPFCDGSADQGSFTQRDVWFHHLYVHDTTGEGFYIGSTQSNGHTITCDMQQEVHQPHFLEGIALTDSRIERTGWDGVQVGMARERCTVARNVIVDVGNEGVEDQQQGLQIGTFSTCEIDSNVLVDGPTNGIFVLTAGETWAHDNVIVDFAGDGIYANVNDRFEGVRYRFHFNTIVNSGGAALRVFGPTLGPSDAISNLVVGPNQGISAGSNVSWTEQGNVTLGSTALARFVGSDDYHIEADSPARGAGVAVDGLEYDNEGYPRSAPPSAGAYEYRDPSVDAGVMLRDAGSPFPPSSAGGGCGCRIAHAGEDVHDTYVWLSLAITGLVLTQRARRRSR